MKLIHVDITEEYIKILEKLIDINTHREERREEISRFTRQRIRNEILNAENVVSTLILDKENFKSYELCIFCGRILHNPKKPYKFKKYNIIELRACCFCLKKFEDKSFEELPTNIREKILKEAEKIYKPI